jgi:hypothetical protein
MHSYIDEGKIAGIGTLVIHHGEVIHSECYGMLDLEAGKPVQPDSIFRIYSLTKPITSVALMMLIEEGHLALEDPISAYIPELRDMKVHLSAADAEASPVEAERERSIGRPRFSTKSLRCKRHCPKWSVGWQASHWPTSQEQRGVMALPTT